MLKKWLAHPLTRGIPLDDPRTTHLRRRVIQEKPFLRSIYSEWYEQVAKELPPGREGVLELGAGAGFLGQFVQGLLASEIYVCPGIDIVLDAAALPFGDGTLRGIAMIDVLHHLPAPRKFFAEAARCVRHDGVLVMIEPWVTSWSRVVYGRLHHEAFAPEAEKWEFDSTGPLSGANGALPWIIFERDRPEFESEFPGWEINNIRLSMPFRYLVSGGVSMRSIMPAATVGLWRNLEKALEPWMGSLAMFAKITLRRR
jgi:SAM-dependent methyltransferase